ncbi:MAG: type VI secretion system-associated protein TagF [Myxococcota bacterium]
MVFWRKKARQPPVVTCYGKLPATGDFIRHQASGPESAAFDQWLGTSVHRAREAMGASFAEHYQPAAGLFVYRGDDGTGDEPERGLIGAWASSGDSAGRKYPMVVATSYDYDDMLAMGAALPLATWPFLQAAYGLVHNGRGLSVADFLGRVQALQPVSLDPPEARRAPYQQWQAGQSMHAMWETTFGSGAMRCATVYDVQAAVEFAVGQERPQTALAMRFPILAGDTYAASVWMDLVLRLGRWERTVLNAFWTPLHDLVVHIGPPQPGTFQELIATGGDAEQVTDLVKPSHVPEAEARTRLGPLAAVVDDTQQSIAGFMQRLG